MNEIISMEVACHEDAKNFNVALGSFLKEHRERMGLEQEQAAIFLDIDLSKYIEFEEGTKMLSTFQLAKLSRSYSMPLCQMYLELSLRGF